MAGDCCTPGMLEQARLRLSEVVTTAARALLKAVTKLAPPHRRFGQRFKPCVSGHESGTLAGSGNRALKPLSCNAHGQHSAQTSTLCLDVCTVKSRHTPIEFKITIDYSLTSS